MKNHWQPLLALSTVLILSAAPAAHALRGDRRDSESRSNRDHSHSNRQIERVRTIMRPLLSTTNQRLDVNEIRVSIVDDDGINAASAGDGQFYVTTGLLRRANDDQLRGVLAHEIAHEDLGHPQKAQIVNVGIGLGAVLLEKVFPNSGNIAPIAGTLITGHYTRPMELAADRHAIVLLERAGYSRASMIDTLTWLMRHNGDTGGGLFATHPATSERIQALKGLR
jgi:predicted Zn-dependent protease